MMNTHSDEHSLQYAGAHRPISLLGLVHEVAVVAIVVIWLCRVLAKAMPNPEAKAKAKADTAEHAVPVEHSRPTQPSCPACAAATRKVSRSPGAPSLTTSTRQAPAASRPVLSRLELRAALDLARAVALPSRKLSSGSLFYANVVGNGAQSTGPTKPSTRALPRRRLYNA